MRQLGSGAFWALVVAAALIILSRVVPGLDERARQWLFVPGAILMVVALLRVVFTPTTPPTK